MRTAKSTPARRVQPILRTTTAIQLAKQYHKFSAAHFLIFDDGSAERLHGHNYRVEVDLEAALGGGGLVFDFQQVKPLLGALLEPLDEHFLVPALHPSLTISTHGDETTVRHGRRRYVVPSDEVCPLPIVNSSAECLAALLATRLGEALQQRFPEQPLVRLAVGVEETPGQRSVCTLHY